MYSSHVKDFHQETTLRSSVSQSSFNDFIDARETLEEINGTIKLFEEEGDQKIQLIISENYREKFKEYKNINHNGEEIDGEFYAEFRLGDEQLYVTGLYPKEEEQEGSDIIMYINSVNGGFNIEKIKELLKFNEQGEIKVTELSKHPKKQIEELKSKVQELEDTKQKAEQEKAELQKQLDDLNNEQQTFDTVIDSLFADGSIKTEIEGLTNLKGQDLTDKVKGLYDEKLKSKIEGIIGSDLSEMNDEDKKKLHEDLQGKILSTIVDGPDKNVDEIVGLIKKELKDSIISASKLGKEVVDLKKQLETKNIEVDKLKANLKAKETELTQLKQQPNAEVDKLKAELEAKEKEKTDLQTKLTEAGSKQQELETANQKAENEKQDLQKQLDNLQDKVQQPKQSNAARYTAGIGIGLAAGLVAFTALERTVKLEMLVMVGIAVASALVVGGITYAVLPGTQVDEAKAQEVNENGKSK